MLDCVWALLLYVDLMRYDGDEIWFGTGRDMGMAGGDTLAEHDSEHWIRRAVTGFHGL